MVKAAIRSGLRRYPRALVDSIRWRNMPSFNLPLRSLADIETSSMAAVWLGHASVLLRLDDVNILVDPVFSKRIGKQMGNIVIGLERLDGILVSAQALPPIDLILITHAHFDHLDRATLRELVAPHTTVVTSRGSRSLIPRGYGTTVELGHDCSVTLHEMDITAFPPAHWGARHVFDQHRKCNSYLLESNGKRVLFAGDTAFTDVFSELGPVDLAVFGIGSYDPWEHMHATPEQVWTMFQSIGGRRLLPVHHSTFHLSDEPIDEPMRRLLSAADEETDKVIQVVPGEIWQEEPVSMLHHLRSAS